MRKLAILLTATIGFFPAAVLCQKAPVDRTAVSNGKKLHFRIIPGRPDDVILFESGGGNDVTVWKDLLGEIATILVRGSIAQKR